MRKNIFISLRTLLRAALSPLYTKQARADKPKLSTRREMEYGYETDDWMFEADNSLDEKVTAYSSELSGLSRSLSGLRQSIAQASGEPCDTVQLKPCAINHHDADLFDGEAPADTPFQDTTIGGEGVYLFDDAPAFHDQTAQHAA